MTVLSGECILGIVQYFQRISKSLHRTEFPALSRKYSHFNTDSFAGKDALKAITTNTSNAGNY